VRASIRFAKLEIGPKTDDSGGDVCDKLNMLEKELPKPLQVESCKLQVWIDG
jgi:hypothetical protein